MITTSTKTTTNNSENTSQEKRRGKWQFQHKNDKYINNDIISLQATKMEWHRKKKLMIEKRGMETSWERLIKKWKENEEKKDANGKAADFRWRREKELREGKRNNSNQPVRLISQRIRTTSRYNVQNSFLVSSILYK